MINKILIETSLINNPIAKNVKSFFKNAEVVEISDYMDYFGKFKKPYLQKRENLNIFIANKKGNLVKEAPDAYGLSGEPHYYYIHAYNCIYECSYCYLQGYFDSPDLVLFINHDEIIADIEKTINQHRQKSDKSIWFHAGEFSDSLALSHITKEIPLYFDFFKNHPEAILEFRTKSVNIKELIKLAPLANVITSFSLSPDSKIKAHDFKTPGLKARIKAIKELKTLGHPIGIHFDPIIYSEGIIEEYEFLIKTLALEVDLREIEYISIGVVRFTKDVFTQVKQNYPDSEFFYSELTKGHDGKIKYPRPIRTWILNEVRRLCIENGADAKSVYLCMED